MISRLACKCRGCRARNDRTFWRIVSGLELGRPEPEVWAATESVVDRINRFGYSRKVS